MKSQTQGGATRTKHGKLPGNEKVSCPHCGNKMKAKHMERHVSIHHPEAVEAEATQLVAG